MIGCCIKTRPFFRDNRILKYIKDLLFSFTLYRYKKHTKMDLNFFSLMQTTANFETDVEPKSPTIDTTCEVVDINLKENTSEFDEEYTGNSSVTTTTTIIEQPPTPAEPTTENKTKKKHRKKKTKRVFIAPPEMVGTSDEEEEEIIEKPCVKSSPPPVIRTVFSETIYETDCIMSTLLDNNKTTSLDYEDTLVCSEKEQLTATEEVVDKQQQKQTKKEESCDKIDKKDYIKSVTCDKNTRKEIKKLPPIPKKRKRETSTSSDTSSSKYSRSLSSSSSTTRHSNSSKSEGRYENKSYSSSSYDRRDRNNKPYPKSSVAVVAPKQQQPPSDSRSSSSTSDYKYPSSRYNNIDNTVKNIPYDHDKSESWNKRNTGFQTLYSLNNSRGDRGGPPPQKWRRDDTSRPPTTHYTNNERNTEYTNAPREHRYPSYDSSRNSLSVNDIGAANKRRSDSTSNKRRYSQSDRDYPSTTRLLPPTIPFDYSQTLADNFKNAIDKVEVFDRQQHQTKEDYEKHRDKVAKIATLSHQQNQMSYETQRETYNSWYYHQQQQQQYQQYPPLTTAATTTYGNQQQQQNNYSDKIYYNSDFYPQPPSQPAVDYINNTPNIVLNTQRIYNKLMNDTNTLSEKERQLTNGVGNVFNALPSIITAAAGHKFENTSKSEWTKIINESFDAVVVAAILKHYTYIDRNKSNSIAQDVFNWCNVQFKLKILPEEEEDKSTNSVLSSTTSTDTSALDTYNSVAAAVSEK